MKFGLLYPALASIPPVLYLLYLGNYLFVGISIIVMTILFLGYRRKQENQNINKLNKSHNSEFHFMQQALQLQLSGQNEEALEMFDKVIALHEEKDYLSLYLKGESLTQLKRYPEALEVLLKAVEIQKNKEVFLSLGNCYQKLEQFEKSLESYQECIKIDKRFATAYLNLGITYQHLGKNEESLKNMDLAIQNGLKEAYIHKAMVLQKMGKGEEAIPVYDAVIKKYPDLVMNYFYKGITLVSLGKVEEAIGCYEKIIEINPQFKDAYTRKLDLLEQLGDEDKIKEFKAVVEKLGFQQQ